MSESAAIAIDQKPCRGVQLFPHENKTNDHTHGQGQVLIHASTFHTNTTDYERTVEKDKCTGNADRTPSQLAPNPIKARCDLCQLACRSIIQYVVCTERCSSIKAITHRSLINSSKTNHVSSIPTWPYHTCPSPNHLSYLLNFYPFLTNHVN